MAASGVTISPASEDDALTLASIMTSAFARSDAAYPLIWPSDEVHADVAVKGVFTPVQQEARLTFKAMKGEQIVGFATWKLPKPDAPKKALLKSEEKVEDGNSGGLPNIHGVNMDFWSEKLNAFKEASERDVETSKDMALSFFFVHPDYQRQGIGSLLLQWGIKKAGEVKAKIWLSSTPQGIAAYEKDGWKVVQTYDIDLGRYGGSGTYSRAWMVRQPEETV